MNIETLKKIFTKTNLFYILGATMLIITAFLLSGLYSSQIAKNAQANLLLADTDGIISSIKSQQKQFSETTNTYFQMLPKNANTLATEIKTNDLTRYFDQLELSFQDTGAMVINSIGYTTVPELSSSVDASLSVRISQQNLIQLLDLFERSGLSDTVSPYLVSVTSVNFVVPEAVLEIENDEENLLTNGEPVYDVSLNLRVYSFEEAVDSVENTSDVNPN
jgi:hypothetical protein